jgi:hypothetical protein
MAPAEGGDDTPSVTWFAAAASPSGDRVRLLWEEEVASLRAGAQSLSPEARRAVRAVLESILREARVDAGIAGSLRVLLAELDLERDRGGAPAQSIERRKASTVSRNASASSTWGMWLEFSKMTQSAPGMRSWISPTTDGVASS